MENNSMHNYTTYQVYIIKPMNDKIHKLHKTVHNKWRVTSTTDMIYGKHIASSHQETKFGY